MFLIQNRKSFIQNSLVIQIDSKTIEETAIGQTKKEVKAQTARQILPVLKQYLAKAS